jgi:hypothetical protein
MGSQRDHHQVLLHKQKGRYFEVKQRSFNFVVRFEKRVLAAGGACLKDVVPLSSFCLLSRRKFVCPYCALIESLDFALGIV